MLRTWYFIANNEKKQYFADVNEDRTTKNKTFWPRAKPFLSDRLKHQERLIWSQNMLFLKWCFFKYYQRVLGIPDYHLGNALHQGYFI